MTQLLEPTATGTKREPKRALGEAAAAPAVQRRAVDRRLRVAQVVTRFIAGAGGVALRGARSLDPERYEVTIVAAPIGSLLDEAREAGMEVVEVDALCPEIDPLRDRRAFATLLRVLAAGNFDVVHTHSAKAGALGRLAAHRLGTPAIVHTFHGFPFHEFQAPWRRHAYIAIERHLGRMTDQFLAVGSAVAAQAVRLGIAAPERLRVVPSAVDVVPSARRPEARVRARRLLGIPEAHPVVGTVGRLDYQKAPEDLLRAVAAMSHGDAVLVWIGDGPWRARAESCAARLGITDRCRFLGERNDVASLLPGFDVFALSSLYEGLPCALVEAMACSVPVVATAVNAVPEIVQPGRTGILVPPRAPHLLARALDHLLDDRQRAQRMADAARDLIGDRFRPEHLGTDLEETYAAALQHHHARGGA